MITLPSGICYRVVKKGDGPKPVLTDTVKVNYRGTLVDGREFDSSYSRNEPWVLQLRRVIKGWTEVLQLMEVGSSWHFVVPSALAYGERGNVGGVIPPNSALVYDLDLLAIMPPTGQGTNGAAAVSNSVPVNR